VTDREQASSQLALAVDNLTKAFPGQLALDRVSFDVRRGETHALVGQNGSGKSTLIKVLSGYHSADAGRVVVAGQQLRVGSPTAAVAAGLRFVHQDLALVPTLNTVDNLALGRGYRRGWAGSIAWRQELSRAQSILADLGHSFNVRVPVARLNAAERTGIAIARALQDYGSEPSVLFLDEPTASLPAAEVQSLYRVIDTVKRRGVAVVYVSHHFNEVFDVCDRVTVLRDGRVIHTVATGDIDEDGLIELTVGRPLQVAPVDSGSRQRSRVTLRVSELRGKSVDGISFEVHAGEVLGIAGVTGSGRDEVASLIFGASRRGGRVEVSGQPVAPNRPDLSLSQGMVLVPSDRHANAALLDLSLRENVTLGHLAPYARIFGVDRRKETADVARWLRRLRVSPPRPELSLGALSGGNQQKVVLARALRRGPSVMILDEPTQGVDVGAKAAIEAIIRASVSDGNSAVIAATESEDLVRLCDRIMVLVKGRVHAVCDGRATDADTLTELTLGRSERTVAA
jgi:ribose transport system ATP-binding protein